MPHERQFWMFDRVYGFATLWRVCPVYRFADVLH